MTTLFLQAIIGLPPIIIVFYPSLGNHYLIYKNGHEKLFVPVSTLFYSVKSQSHEKKKDHRNFNDDFFFLSRIKNDYRALYHLPYNCPITIRPPSL